MRTILDSLTAFLVACLIVLVSSPPASAEVTPPGAPVDVAADAMSFKPVLRATIDEVPPPPAVIGLTVVTLASGARLEVDIPGIEVYAVESGVVTLSVVGAAEILHATDPGKTSIQDANRDMSYELGPGDQAVIGVDTPHALVNESGPPAVLTNVVIFPASMRVPASLPNPPRTAPGVMIQELAVGVAVESLDLMTTPIEVAVEHANLGPEVALPLPEVRDYGLLIVASGQVRLAHDPDEEQLVRGGDIVPLEPGASAIARNTADLPAMVMVLTINSADGRMATPESSLAAPRDE